MRLYVIISIVLIFLACHFSGATAAEKWAVIIGIEDYRDSDIIPMTGAASDAAAISRSLIESAGFSPSNVYLLTSTMGKKGETPKPDVENILRTLAEVSLKSSPDDVFFFFFAGHGITQDEEGFLLTYETVLSDPSELMMTSLSAEDLRRELQRIRAAKALLLFDVNRSGPLKKDSAKSNLLTKAFADPLHIDLETGGGGNLQISASIFSCSPGQRSYAWKSKKRGIFGIAVQEALSGKAADNEGRMTLARFHSYLKERIANLYAKHIRAAIDQSPWIRMEGAGARDWTIATFKERDESAGASVAEGSLPSEMNAAEPEMESGKWYKKWYTWAIAAGVVGGGIALASQGGDENGGNGEDEGYGWGDVVDDIPAPGGFPGGLGWDGSFFWITDVYDGKIYKLNADGGVVDFMYSDYFLPTGLTCVGNFLWVADWYSLTILKINKNTAEIAAVISSPGPDPFGLAWDGSYLWNADTTDHKIYKMNTSGGIVSIIDAPAAFPMGLSWDGQHLWCVSDDMGKVYKMHTSGEVIDYFEAPGNGPTGLTIDGSYAWLADSFDFKIYKIYIGIGNSSADIRSNLFSDLQINHGIRFYSPRLLKPVINFSPLTGASEKQKTGNLKLNHFDSLPSER